MEKIKNKIYDKIDEFKLKADSLQTAITNKAFDVNLLKAIQKDFHIIIEQNNDIVLGLSYIFKILEMICKKENIEIPIYIKNHFIIENE